MKKLLSVLVFVLALLFASGGVVDGKDIKISPNATVSAPESCPRLSEFKLISDVVLDANKDTKMLLISQEGQRGNEFLSFIAVVQFNEDRAPDIFVLAIVHSTVNMDDPEKSTTKNYADKQWIETGVPSNILVEVPDLPPDPAFYKNLVNKRLPLTRKI